jgi:primosomal protein N' (replication factor Y)
MKIIRVTPISRGIPKETLHYFTRENVGIGDIIQAPLKSRLITARVVEVENVKDAKTEIKALPFGVRKVTKVEAPNFLSEAFTEAVSETAIYFAGTTGSVLKSVLPPVFLLSKSAGFSGERPANRQAAGSPAVEKFILQTDSEERFGHYKSIIRQEFAAKRSVFFCFPTAEAAKNAGLVLARGILEYTITLHAGLSKKNLIEEWKRASAINHPVLVIATKEFFSLPRTDFGTIVVDNESSRFYKSLSRPFVDFRTFAEFLAERLPARLIFGDFPLRVETLNRYKKSELSEYLTTKFRLITAVREEVVALPLKRATGQILCPEVLEVLKNCRSESENVFILTPKRGYSPYTFCRDCGSPVQCERCSAPLSLHKTERFKNSPTTFICHHCGFFKDSLARCRLCGSWNLMPLGVGLELLAETIRTLFPALSVSELGRDSISTDRQAGKIVEKFLAMPGGVLVGTEMAMAFLPPKIDNLILIYPDSLLNLPNFRINEEIFGLVLKAKSMAAKRFIVQVMNNETPPVKLAAAGNIFDFYRAEIKDREQFGYPPFKLLIKITLKGRENEVLKEMAGLEGQFSAFQPVVFPAFLEKARGKFVSHALIKLGREQWPNQALVEKLLSLPSRFSVDVEPESVL